MNSQFDINEFWSHFLLLSIFEKTMLQSEFVCSSLGNAAFPNSDWFWLRNVALLNKTGMTTTSKLATCPVSEKNT